MKSRRFWLTALMAALGCFAWSQAHACDFCQLERGPTLLGEYNLAEIVLFGHMEPGTDGTQGVDFIIEEVLKSHPLVKDLKRFPMRRDRMAGSDKKWVLFCNDVKGTIDAYKGIDLSPKTEMVTYLRGVIKNKDKSKAERLRYAFDYLNSSEFWIGIDAYREFGMADYKDYKDLAKTLPADKIADWLKDPATPLSRHGLYSSLLGHCGTEKHAELLRKMIDEGFKSRRSDIDGLLAGYVMLKPKEGWPLIQGVLKDTKQEFGVRFACLRIAKFLREQRPDLVDAKDLTAGMAVVVDDPVMADIGIDYLRKAKVWDVTDKVLDLFTTKSHDLPIIKREIVRFALRSPSPRAVEFIRAQRQRDDEWVKDIETLLNLDEQ